MKLKSQSKKVLITILWIGIWQLAYLMIHQPLLFAGPWQAGLALVRMLQKISFWKTLVNSTAHILTGYLMGMVLAIICGMAATANKTIEHFLWPVWQFLKAVPVAAFVIMVLFWSKAKNLSVIISAMVTFPIIYGQLTAIKRQLPEKMEEMSRLYRLSFVEKWRYCILPLNKNSLLESTVLALGMSYKAGIAAEVIGQPDFTIGDQLYMAKIYFSTGELYAWIFVIIFVSYIAEQLFKLIINWLLKQVMHHVGKNVWHKSSVRLSSTETESLSCENLTVSYGDHVVIDHYTKQYVKGEIYWYKQASGFGKTTLFKTLAGLILPTTGKINRHMSDEKKQNEISMAFQENTLCLQLSAIDNLWLIGRHDPKITKTYIRQYLSQILPEKVLDKSVETYSVGMARRVEVARALFLPVKLVFLDEPFAGLDQENQERLYRLIEDEKKEKTILIADHTRIQSNENATQ